MKTCSYCGQASTDSAAFCASCGTEFIAPPTESASEPYRRPPRPEAATVVLRTFPQEAPAQLALAALRDARIEAFVATDDCGGLYPPLGGASPFRLVVSEVHREAAEQVLAERGDAMPPEPGPRKDPEPALPEPSPRPPAPPSTLRPLVLFALGILVGILITLGYQGSQRQFSGTVPRDLNGDGRIDLWDRYRNGDLVRTSTDDNGDERPDSWFYYEDGRAIRWERDGNFDGKVDEWGAHDGRGVSRQSTVDLDYDGRPDVTNIFGSGRFKESHYVVPQSGQIWKKNFYTNGDVREERIDRDRNGTFDERVLYDIFGVEIRREKLP